MRLTNEKYQVKHERNTSHPFNLKNVEDIGKRYVHSAYFKNLVPDTTYEISVYKRPGENETFGSPLIKRFYKTTPGRDAQ